MNFLKACLAWAAIALVLGSGLWLLTAKGNPWLFVVAVLGFAVTIGRICCKAH